MATPTPPPTTATAALFGSTGAVGSNILKALLTTEAFTSIKTISRRQPTVQSPKLETLIDTDSSKWSPILRSIDPRPTVVFNAVGTTKAQAGGVENQWKIDHDLCVDTARAARHADVPVYVFVSSAGTRGWMSSRVEYSKMKVGVEDAIKELGFEQAIILRPGVILGGRETPKAPLFEAIVSNLHRISPGFQDRIGQDQKIIGRAAVAAAKLAREGKAPSKYWILEYNDILKYGRDEWTE